MCILNLKHLKHLFCGLAALRAWLGDLVDAEQLKHLKHLFCSDLDQKRAFFWSKSEMKHLKHLKHLKHQS